MKNVVLVFKGNHALALDNTGATIKKTSTGSFLANLETLMDVLNTIPAGEMAQEVTTIHIPDFIQGLSFGTALEYIRVGKTKSGTQLTPQEIQAFKDVYKMLADRILNVRLSLSKYIPKTNTEVLTLRNNAYIALNNYMANVGGNTVAGGIVQTQQLVDPDKALREAFDKQIIEYASQGNIEMMEKIMAMRNNLKEPTMVQGTAQVASTTPQVTNSYIPTPDFKVEGQSTNDQPIDTPQENTAIATTTNAEVVDSNVEFGANTTDASNINWTNV